MPLPGAAWAPGTGQRAAPKGRELGLEPQGGEGGDPWQGLQPGGRGQGGKLLPVAASPGAQQGSVGVSTALRPWESLLAELIGKHNASESSPGAVPGARECCPVGSGLVLSAADLQSGLACWASSGSSVALCRCGSCSGTRQLIAGRSLPVPEVAQIRTMLARPWLCYKSTVPGQVQRGTWLK